MEQAYGAEGFWHVHAEYPGGNSRKIDIIAFEQLALLGLNLSPVSILQTTGRVFEIEPADDPSAIVKGYAEILSKHTAISHGEPPFVHLGNLRMQDEWAWARSMGGFEGTPYNWLGVNWVLGDQLSPADNIGPVYVRPSGLASGQVTVDAGYWAMLIVPGLILYIEDNDLKRRALKVATITAEEAARYIRDQYLKAKQRPDGGNLPDLPPLPAPGFAPQPAFTGLSPEMRLFLLLAGSACLLLSPFPDDFLIPLLFGAG